MLQKNERGIDQSMVLTVDWIIAELQKSGKSMVDQAEWLNGRKAGIVVSLMKKKTVWTGGNFSVKQVFQEQIARYLWAAIEWEGDIAGW